MSEAGRDVTRILMIEDSPEDAELIARALAGRAIEFERVDTEATLRVALGAKDWQLVLSDWSLPGLDPIHALEVVQSSGADLPVVIVSGTIGEEAAVNAMRAGARDYVSKNDLRRLPFVVERELRERAARELQRREERERRHAHQAGLERKRVLALSGDIGLALAESRTLHETLQPCVEALIEHTGAVLARIWTVDADGKMLELQASAGIVRSASDGGKSTPRRVPIETMPVARERRFLSTKSYTEDAESPERELAKREGLVAFVGHPLFVDDKVVGVMEVFGTEPFSAVMVKSLAAISDTIAVGIRRKSVELANKALEEQLRQAQKMEAVGRLAGGVAHDFNNLLSVILSYADLITDDLDQKSPLRADVDEIKRAGVRAAELTKQLLMFSRQQVLERRVIDLNELLANTKKMLERIVGEDVALLFQDAPDLARVRADPGSIEQVIMNLVVNARDAMPQGGRITIETANISSPSGPRVMLAVSDTGAGMDEETKRRIFEPFFTTKARGKGTGLGLSTVFGIVEQSGGTIAVTSALGHGTTFRIELPALADSVAIDHHTTPPIPTTLKGSETVLLVEDEDQVRTVVRGILRRHGYDVIEARNAGEAILACENAHQNIDLLLTDVVMPRMSGPELALRLRKARPTMKVLCMSGYTDENVLLHGIGGSDPETAIAYLQKPITPQGLAIKVREVLSETRNRSAMPRQE